MSGLCMHVTTQLHPQASSCDANFALLQPTVISNLQLWKVILYTPEENSFDEKDILRMGYSLNSSPTRLVMRSPYNMAGNYVQKVGILLNAIMHFCFVSDVSFCLQVADVDMIVLKSLVLYRDLWMMTIVESSAACPISETYTCYFAE